MSKPHSNTDGFLSPRDGALRLRLLLSWRERLALQKRRHPGAERAARQEELKLRQQARRAIEETGERLQRALASGAPEGETVARLRHDIAQYNVLLKANASSDLGGFADLPLDDYPKELGVRVVERTYGLERDDFITIIASIIIIVVLCGGIAWYHLWRADVEVNIDRPGPRQVSIKFQNDSSFATHLVGPWPEGGVDLKRTDYGLALHCRAVGSEEFQDCTNLREAWTYQRRAISATKPVQVESGMAVTVILDTTQLERDYGSEIAEIRIDCGNPWRRRQFSFTEKLRDE